MICRLLPLLATAALLLLLAPNSSLARRLQTDDAPEVHPSVSAEEQGSNRQARILYQNFQRVETSTTTSTTTVLTVTYCWSTQAGAITGGACTRKKRAISTDPLEELRDVPHLIVPSAASEVAEAIVAADHDDGSEPKVADQILKSGQEEDFVRQPRNMYWFTSTSTSTSVTTLSAYTATTTIQYTVCTPAVSLIQMCG